ncbi:hypothetical protein M885DRAFT_465191 [Pelagophyceae sp. CCMP2097]|nr:hypothetical protein M885DRAFT_465191 [Pelagophyceae sp. CCMP2097]
MAFLLVLLFAGGAAFAPTRPLAAKRVSAQSLVAQAEALAFSKYHGLGNDFLLVDNRESSEPKVSPDEAAKMCDRNFGIGADGVIFVLPGKDGADFTMRIYNSDSTEPEMCGNGIRCMARYLDAELKVKGREIDGGNEYLISTGAGPIVPVVRGDGQITVDMGPPELRAEKVPTKLAATTADGTALASSCVVAGETFETTCVSMGNPHAITFVEDVDAFDLAKFGRQMSAGHPMFPKNVNAEFVECISRTHFKMRVWERGAGPTLACGTGACAVAVAAMLTGRADRSSAVTVSLPGGPLIIEWREADGKIYMTGPAEFVFSGELPR